MARQITYSSRHLSKVKAQAEPRSGKAKGVPRADKAGAEKSRVQSLAKGFRVLEVFTPDEPELVLADVARAAGLDNGSAFRFLNTLVALGYVEKVDGTKRFRLTLKCLDLGFNAIARSELRQLARPLLRAIVGESIEAASIAVLDGAEIVYVERVQAGLARLGVDVHIGSRAPVYSTAVGQVILAHMPRALQIEILQSRPRERRTTATIVELDALLAKFERIRRAGFAISDQENVAGLRVLAAPLVDADGTVLAALSVAAPAFNLSLAAFDKAARQPVITATRKLSRALQAAGSSSHRPVKIAAG